MKSTFTGAQAASYLAARDVASMRGACLAPASLTPPATDSGTFVPERPTTHVVAPFAAPKGVRKQHNNMALIAATGGASGAHPNWDPV